jgi:hypothetical protein
MRDCGGRSSPRRHPRSYWHRPVGPRRPARAGWCRQAREAASGERAADPRGLSTAPERECRWAVSTPEAPGYCHMQPPTTADRCREEAPTRDVSEKRSVLLATSRTHSARSGTLMRGRRGRASRLTRVSGNVPRAAEADMCAPSPRSRRRVARRAVVVARWSSRGGRRAVVVARWSSRGGRRAVVVRVAVSARALRRAPPLQSTRRDSRSNLRRWLR